MAAKIIWSERALSDLRTIVEYLEQNWSDKEKQKFAVLLELRIGVIQETPKSYKISVRFKGTRECLVHKNLSLFYTTDEEAVFIITLWDNRRNPKYIRSGK